MTTLTLTTWQRRRLERQLRETLDARVYRRTLAILEVAQGEAVASVARRLRVTSRVVHLWVEAYGQGHDPEVLRDSDRSGRPSLLTDQDRVLLLELLHHSPQDFDDAATEWTVGLLQEYLRGCTGKHLSEDTLRRELHRLDYAWKRPRYALDPDPQLRGKKEAYPRADQAVAAAQHGAGRRRDRPAAVPAVTRVLVAAGPAQAGAPVRPQPAADRVRSAEPAHRVAAVLAARAPAGG